MGPAAAACKEVGKDLGQVDSEEYRQDYRFIDFRPEGSIRPSSLALYLTQAIEIHAVIPASSSSLVAEEEFGF